MRYGLNESNYKGNLGAFEFNFDHSENSDKLNLTMKMNI